MIDGKYIIKGIGLGFIIMIGILFQTFKAIAIASALVLFFWWFGKSINDTSKKLSKKK